LSTEKRLKSLEGVLKNPKKEKSKTVLYNEEVFFGC
jgi:hypothetical protein